jgi:hypothetical protein
MKSSRSDRDMEQWCGAASEGTLTKIKRAASDAGEAPRRRHCGAGNGSRKERMYIN